MNESHLIRQLADGDSRAFGRLYDHYAPELMGMCMKYVHIQEDAEEIIEDVFVSLWNNRDNLRRTDSIRPLLYRSLRNRAIDSFRRRINSPIYADFVETVNLHAPDSGINNIEYKEFERAIIAVIDTLPPTQKAVVILSKLENMSNAEISERLNLNIQTVKNSLSMGLSKLRERLNTPSMRHLITTCCAILLSVEACSGYLTHNQLSF